MGKFNAATAVEALEFDFTAFGGPKGVIPEPSTATVKAFYKELGKIQEEVQLRLAATNPDAAPPQVVDGKIVKTEEDEVEAGQKALDTFVNLTEEESEHWNQRGLQATAEVCGHVFTVEDLERLPYRVGRAFMRWLGEELRPEEQTPATKR